MLKIEKNIIFLDMDGVLADFIKGVAKLSNGKLIAGKSKTEDIMKFWQTLGEVGEEFWENLEKYDWSDDLVELAESKGEVFLLTAPTYSNTNKESCISGKIKWIKKYYPHLLNKSIFTYHKYLLAKPNTTLIDDTEEQIIRFKEHGGNVILFPQDWNHWSDIEHRIDFVKEYLE